MAVVARRASLESPSLRRASRHAHRCATATNAGFGMLLGGLLDTMLVDVIGQEHDDDAAAYLSTDRCT